MMSEQTSISAKSEKRAVLATVFNVISFIFFAAFIFALIYGIFVVPIIIILSLPIAAMALLFRFLVAKANVSFDYRLGDGEFVIGKVINNKKRKEIFTLCPQDILRVYDVTELTGERKDKKTVYCSANVIASEGKRFALLEIKDKLILIEADEALINGLKNKYLY